MPARVYECQSSEVEALRKLLAYDPYLDPNIIPRAPAKMTPEEEKQHEAKVREAQHRLQTDKSLRAIFARQDYSLKDGTAIGDGSGKSYLYLSATDEFFTDAEARFNKDFKTVKRASKESEDRIIAIVKAEQEKASSGFGSIFG